MNATLNSLHIHMILESIYFTGTSIQLFPNGYTIWACKLIKNA